MIPIVYKRFHGTAWLALASHIGRVRRWLLRSCVLRFGIPDQGNLTLQFRQDHLAVMTGRVLPLSTF
jgi:hypothetical protein